MTLIFSAGTDCCCCPLVSHSCAYEDLAHWKGTQLGSLETNSICVLRAPYAYPTATCSALFLSSILRSSSNRNDTLVVHFRGGSITSRWCWSFTFSDLKSLLLQLVLWWWLRLFQADHVVCACRPSSRASKLEASLGYLSKKKPICL